MKTLSTHMCLITTVMLASTSGCAAMTNTNRLGSTTVAVRVVDDVGQPIVSVHSGIMSASDRNFNSGVTDTNGTYAVFLQNSMIEIGGHFNKQGYYETSGPFWRWGESTGIVPIKLLLSAGVDVNAKDKNGDTALNLAKNLEIIKLLRDAGANE